jgi:hypothetical protein
MKSFRKTDFSVCSYSIHCFFIVFFVLCPSFLDFTLFSFHVLSYEWLRPVSFLVTAQQQNLYLQDTKNRKSKTDHVIKWRKEDIFWSGVPPTAASSSAPNTAALSAVQRSIRLVFNQLINNVVVLDRPVQLNVVMDLRM